MTVMDEWSGMKSPANDRHWRAAMSNGQGRMHETLIEGACRYYSSQNRAHITKIPEPFRVMKKAPTGIATVRFTAHAEPDFKGCITGGRLICFEAKYTDTARINQDVVTKTQADVLERYDNLGAIAAVCVGIQQDAFMIPWAVFGNMKKYFGHKYAVADDVRVYQVKNDGVIKFLDFIDARMRGRWEDSRRQK